MRVLVLLVLLVLLLLLVGVIQLVRLGPRRVGNGRMSRASEGGRTRVRARRCARRVKRARRPRWLAIRRRGSSATVSGVEGRSGAVEINAGTDITKVVDEKVKYAGMERTMSVASKRKV